VVDPEKIVAVMEWETHRNMDEVISFMGLVGYYRQIIRTSHGFPILSHSCSEQEINLNGQRNVQQFLSS